MTADDLAPACDGHSSLPPPLRSLPRPLGALPPPLRSLWRRVRRVAWTTMALVAAILLIGALSVGREGALNIQGTPGMGTDPFTDPLAQHQTMVEPSTVARDRIVSAFQEGRFYDGGSDGIGVAISDDNGRTWIKRTLPGITRAQGGRYDRVTDPTVAFDPKHGVWMVVADALVNEPDVTGAAIVVSRSTDGGVTWDNPRVVASIPGGSLDKNAVGVDASVFSPYIGNTYVEFDDHAGNFFTGDTVYMVTSRDGGVTWGPPLKTADSLTGIGGQPLVQPNGRVIVPIADPFIASLRSFVSDDGGRSWSWSAPVDVINAHDNAGHLRADALPSAVMDRSGRVYVAWQDCRVEAQCSANDILMTTSDDGVNWTPTVRIPLDPVGSGVDHFIPGLGVDPTTSRNHAHLALTYYYYPSSSCEPATCQLEVGYSTSTDGGATWTAPQRLAGPMSVSWFPNTTQGFMVGDYEESPIGFDRRAHPVFAIAGPPGSGPSGPFFNAHMVSPPGGLPVRDGSRPTVPTPLSNTPPYPTSLKAGGIAFDL